MAGTLRRDHEHVEIGSRRQQVEVDVEAVGEGERGAPGLHVGGQVGVVDVRLQLVRGQHHHDVGPLGAIGRAHDGEAGALGLLRRRGLGFSAMRTSLTPESRRFMCGGVALAAVADDRDLLALDQVYIGVTIVVDTHRAHSSWQCALGNKRGLRTTQPSKHQSGILPLRMSALHSALPLLAASFFLGGCWYSSSVSGNGD